SGDFSSDIKELKTAIPRMNRFGTRYIRVMSWPNDKENPWSDADWAREVIRRLKELTKMAEDGGIVLAHENCSGWGGESVENSLRLVEEMNSPAFRLLYDTGNVIPHGQNPWEFYIRTRPYTVYVHVKDYRRQGDKFVATFPGEGQGQVKEILADLLASEFSGGISIEPHLASVVHEGKLGEKELAYQTYITYGRKLMALVESLRKS
ncbi:MAG: sugar phosphate isomerase/epimerase, partial [Candidatus Omnitrophica bacterium]|nr:sugar phosphate isomerase/epimerase [Candidatus Omnitrophota bacterium]